MCQIKELWQFFVSQMFIKKFIKWKRKKFTTLSYGPSGENKITFDPSTLKVGILKVHLFFPLEVLWRSYDIFVFFYFINLLMNIRKRQNRHNSFMWLCMAKIRTHLFLQLWKLKKEKCPYFFPKGSYEEVMTILSFFTFEASIQRLVKIRKFS